MCEAGPMMKVQVSGSGKGAIGWFPLAEAQVYHDHPYSAQFGEAVMVDLLNKARGVSARIALELSPESARALAQALLDTVSTVEARG